jgi:hypothetical protein
MHEQVMHELLSDQVHIDVFLFPPNDSRPFWTLVTSGMSDLPMKVPEGFSNPEKYQRAEMVVSLPANWISKDDFGAYQLSKFDDESRWWPIRWLKYLARFPHSFETWLWYEHTLPNDDPPKPIGPNTEMIGFLLGPPVTWPVEKMRMQAQNGASISFIALYPVHADEMTLKLNKGADALFDLFAASQVTEIIDPRRSSVVPKKRNNLTKWFS